MSWVLDACAKSAGGDARHALADVAQADNAHRLAVQFVQAGDFLVAAPAPGRDHGMLPGYPAIDGEHKQDRVLGDGHGVGAAIVADGNLGGPRCFQIHAVISGAEQLHQLQLGCALIERRIHRAGLAKDILGLGQRRAIFRRSRCAEHHLETRRRQLRRDLPHLGHIIHDENPTSHSDALPAFNQASIADRPHSPSLRARSMPRRNRGICRALCQREEKQAWRRKSTGERPPPRTPYP